MRILTVVGLLGVLAGCGEKKAAVVVPDSFHARFTTSAGDIVVEARKEWGARGVDRFHELLRMKYFNEGRFFRVVPGFIAQFGVHKDFETHGKWREFFILDDKRVLSNARGTLVFAQNGPNTRATEMFFNLKDQPLLDGQGFAPFARVTEGLDVLDKLYSGYGEMRPAGRFIDVGRVEEGANAYLVPRFPKLDFIKKTEILP
ncbi:MAG: peptidylprolyl isomerase [Acidobacteriota bacterium]